ncbi:hypothetical protein J132_07578 [Termitomyces sp. J132]|nr:hypothetical protein J132_07578 [Termitomyces sp. J132]
MPSSLFRILTSIPLLLVLVLKVLDNTGGALGFTSYANDFVDPGFIVKGVFGNNTLAAQGTILQWAKDSAVGGPWSVIQKNVTAPSGDVHDYMSWAPYWWPDCSKAGNTTELTPEQIWKTCTYVSRDGKFNPDGRLINDVGNFQSLSDMVLYNSIASALTGSGSSSYSTLAVEYIKTWFLDDETKMNPNLNYAQMQRGPTGQTGSHTGILDLKGMAKIVTGIEIFRKMNCTDWTGDLDSRMNDWTNEYIQWLESAAISLEEEAAPNNHGTFWYNQVAALKILVGDIPGALNVTNAYFAKQYMSQITANGEQATARSPAMITNARLSAYAGDPSVWNKTTNEGSTIRTALEFAMTLNAANSNETSYTAELYPSVAAVGAIYGDPEGRYADFLAEREPTYAEEAWFLWNQPLRGGEEESKAIQASGTASARGSQVTSLAGNKGNGARERGGVGSWVLIMLVGVGLQASFAL